MIHFCTTVKNFWPTKGRYSCIISSAFWPTSSSRTISTTIGLLVSIIKLLSSVCVLTIVSFTPTSDYGSCASVVVLTAVRSCTKVGTFPFTWGHSLVLSSSYKDNRHFWVFTLCIQVVSHRHTNYRCNCLENRGTHRVLTQLPCEHTSVGSPHRIDAACINAKFLGYFLD